MKPEHYVYTKRFVGNTLLSLVVSSIAAISVGGMLGYDITQFKLNGSPQRLPVLHRTQVETKR